jgi:hypothetical protein
LHQSWLTNAGFTFDGEAGSEEDQLCEISSLVSYFGEGLETYAKKNRD